MDAALDHLVLACTTGFKSNAVNACDDALNTALAIVLEPELRQALQQLKDQLPAATQSRETLYSWWQRHYPAWLEQLKVAIAKHRNTQHDWHFSPEQQELLQQYYDANQLLLDCLNSNGEVTAAVRQEIEAALLLPQKELEEREWGSSF